VLRIGRAKAYALTREYRQTEGRSGLPVVDFGDVLRVPASRIAATPGVTVPEVIAAVRGSFLTATGRPSHPIASRTSRTSRHAPRHVGASRRRQAVEPARHARPSEHPVMAGRHR